MSGAARLTDIAHAAPMARVRNDTITPDADACVVPRRLDVEVVPRARGGLALVQLIDRRLVVYEMPRSDSTHHGVVAVELRVGGEEDAGKKRVGVPQLVEKDVALREDGMAACA